MDDTDLWSTREEVEYETFVDEFGNEHKERLNATPPANATEKGPAAFNAHRLDVHTGQGLARSKGADVPGEDFDDDLRRAAPHFTADALRRSSVQVALNRRGVQEGAALDRDRVMYDGYNLKTRTEPRPLVPTRRGAQALSVVGAERHDPRVVRAGPQGRREAPLRSGAHATDAGDGRGTVTAVLRRGADADAVHMGAHGAVARASNEGGGERATVARPAARSAALLAEDALPVQENARVTHAQRWKWMEERPEVSLAADCAPGAPARATRTDAHRAGPAGERALGDRDAAAARPAVRTTTYAQQVYAHAQRYLGAKDAAQGAVPRLVAALTGRRGLAAAHDPTRRIGPHAPAPHAQTSYEATRKRVLESARARDNALDAAVLERRVAQYLEHEQERSALPAVQERDLADDAYAAPATTQRDVAYPLPAARGGRARAHAADAHDLRDAARHERHATTRRAANAAPTLAHDAVALAQDGRNRTGAEAASAVPARHARGGKADLTSARAPPSAGPPAARAPAAPEAGRKASALPAAVPRAGMRSAGAARAPAEVVLARGVRA